MFLHVDNVKSLNILLCQALLTMRRHKGILKTVGLERVLLHKHPKSLIWCMFGTQLAVDSFSARAENESPRQSHSHKLGL